MYTTILDWFQWYPRKMTVLEPGSLLTEGSSFCIREAHYVLFAGWAAFLPHFSQHSNSHATVRSASNPRSKPYCLKSAKTKNRKPCKNYYRNTETHSEHVPRQQDIVQSNSRSARSSKHDETSLPSLGPRD